MEKQSRRMIVALVLLVTSGWAGGPARADSVSKPAKRFVEETAPRRGRLESRVAALLRLSDRPSMGVLLDAVADESGALPEENPFTASGRVRAAPNPNILYTASRALPRTIALFEKAYPGAVYAPLGRDAAPIGDALDAFYTAYGQRGRVAPLRGSGTTVRSASEDDLVAFVESAGFDYRELLAKGTTHRPFVLMDRTSYHAGSQLRSILAAVYRRFAKEGGDPSRLVRVLNGVALGSTSSTLFALNEYTNFESYFRDEGRSATSYELPQTILQISWDNSSYRYGGFIDDGNSEWHDGYGSMQHLDDGTVRGVPSEDWTVKNRLQALANKYAVYQLVSQPEFLAEVRREARSLGYSFPIQSPVPESAWLRSFRSGLKAFVPTIDRSGNQQSWPGRMTDDFLPWMELASDSAPSRKLADQAALAVIEAMLDARQQGRLAGINMDAQLAMGLRNLQNIADPDVVSGLAKLASKSRLLSHAIGALADGTAPDALRFARLRGRVEQAGDCEGALVKRAG